MNRESNYRFSFNKMLALSGNTAPYMLYAFARINGINRKLGDEFQVHTHFIHLVHTYTWACSSRRMCTCTWTCTWINTPARSLSLSLSRARTHTHTHARTHVLLRALALASR